MACGTKGKHTMANPNPAIRKKKRKKTIKPPPSTKS
tara:strand:- start:386 stop:493 length:108 start_codon:yes stop_codon:yes gene_type:complete